MAVNVSARQLDSDQLIADIGEVLAASRLDPDALTIEITETTLMRNVEETARRLGAINCSASASRSTTSVPATRRSPTYSDSRSTR